MVHTQHTSTSNEKDPGICFRGDLRQYFIEADEYLTELSRYMHLNPVRAGIVEKPEQYKWSSYMSYAGHCKPQKWLKTGFILSCFDQHAAAAQRKYQTFVEDRLGKEYISPLKGTLGTSILGSSSFVEEISATYIQGKEDGNIPALRQLTRRPTPEDIVAEAKVEFPDNEKLARRASIHLCHKHSGQRLGKIGECFSVRDTAISEASRKFAKELETDEKLREVVERIKGRLKICGM